MKLKFLLIVFIVIFPLSFTSFSFNSKVNILNHYKVNQIFPLTIDGNSELNSSATSGVGSENDPYIIENLNSCLWIKNTNKSFILKNIQADCTIRLENVENARLENNVVNNATDGFEFVNVYNLILVNNEARNGRNSGFKFSYGRNITVNGNLVTNHWYGYSFDSIRYLQFTNNTIENSLYTAIYFYFVRNSTITDNYVLNNGDDGFSISSSDYNTFINNEVTDNGQIGFRISSSDNNLFSDNKVKGNLEFDLKEINSEGNIFTDNNIGNIFNPHLEKSIYLLITMVLFVVAIGTTIFYDFDKINKIKITTYSALIAFTLILFTFDYDLTLELSLILIIVVFELIQMMGRTLYVNYYKSEEEKIAMELKRNADLNKVENNNN